MRAGIRESRYASFWRKRVGRFSCSRTEVQAEKFITTVYCITTHLFGDHDTESDVNKRPRSHQSLSRHRRICIHHLCSQDWPRPFQYHITSRLDRDWALELAANTSHHEYYTSKLPYAVHETLLDRYQFTRNIKLLLCSIQMRSNLILTTSYRQQMLCSGFQHYSKWQVEGDQWGGQVCVSEECEGMETAPGWECKILGTVYLTSTTTRKMWAQSPIYMSIEGLCVGANINAFEKNDYQSVKPCSYDIP